MWETNPSAGNLFSLLGDVKRVKQHRLLSYLEDGHLIPQLALLFGGEPHFVDDFDGHISARFSVFA